MKKGFTLVELLAVLVILAIIALITTVAVNSIISDSKTAISEVQQREFEKAAKLYHAKEGMDAGATCVNVSALINNGYIDNSKNEETFTGSVQISYSNNKYSYKYQGSSCEVICALTDSDGDNVADTGEEVTCTKDSISESFYVVDNSNGKVNMLSKYNITLSTTSPLQDTSGAKNSVEFSSTNYWYDSSNNLIVDTNYAAEGRTMPYVYNSSSNVYPYVEAYRDVLEGMGVNVIGAKLLSYEQAIDLGCTYDEGYINSCQYAPSWLYSSYYWLGSIYVNRYPWYVVEGGIVSMSENLNIGIRPVITISALDIYVPVCQYTEDNAGNEMITCGTENFYPIEETSSTVTALAKYNLKHSVTPIKQDPSGSNNPIAFSTSNYWYDNSGNLIVDADYASEGRNPYVYNSSSNIYQYVEAYRDVLEVMGINVIDAKLLSFEQALNIGCTRTPSYSCKSAPSWVYLSSYWTGTSSSTKYLWYVSSAGGFSTINYNYSDVEGIRPLITFDKSDIG